jgi:hypothetical protein
MVLASMTVSVLAWASAWVSRSASVWASRSASVWASRSASESAFAWVLPTRLRLMQALLLVWHWYSRSP